MFWLLLAGVVAIAVMLRVTGRGWDEYTGLHPDERHMAFVVGDMVRGWEDAPGLAALNPRRHHPGYVYGDLPVALVAMLCRLAGVDGFADVLRWGRLAAVLADLLALWCVLVAVRVAGGGMLALVVAAAGYGFMPLAVQHSHFFTVDVFASAAAAMALIYLMGVSLRPRAAAAAGIATGAALACKLSMMVLVVAGLVVAVLAQPRGLRPAVLRVVAFALGAGLAFRLLNASAFDGVLLPAQAWLDSLAQLRASQTVSLDGSPPAWQWVGIRPGLHVAANLAAWGVGPGFALLSLATALTLGRSDRWRVVMVPAVVVLAFVVLLAFRPVQPQRYFLPMLPALVVLTALALERVHAASRCAGLWLAGTSLALMLHLGYGLALNQMHRDEHTRLAASRWIWAHWPPASVIAVETDWDDALPWFVRLPGEKHIRGGFGDNAYRSANLRLTDPWSPAKLEHLTSALSAADYLVISSGRQLDVMPRFPERFPLVARYYAALFAGELGFEPVATFRRPLRVWGLELDDSRAEEPWTVYDHPRVWLFARSRSVDAPALRALLDPGS